MGRVSFDYDHELKKGGVLKALADISGEYGLCLFVPVLPILEDKSYDSVLTLNNGKLAGIYDRLSDAIPQISAPLAGGIAGGGFNPPLPSYDGCHPFSKRGKASEFITLGRALKVYGYADRRLSPLINHDIFDSKCIDGLIAEKADFLLCFADAPYTHSVVLYARHLSYNKKIRLLLCLSDGALFINKGVIRYIKAEDGVMFS